MRIKVYWKRTAMQERRQIRISLDSAVMSQESNQTSCPILLQDAALLGWAHCQGHLHASLSLFSLLPQAHELQSIHPSVAFEFAQNRSCGSQHCVCAQCAFSSIEMLTSNCIASFTNLLSWHNTCGHFSWREREKDRKPDRNSIVSPLDLRLIAWQNHLQMNVCQSSKKEEIFVRINEFNSRRHRRIMIESSRGICIDFGE